jgi:hypothetical protein
MLRLLSNRSRNAGLGSEAEPTRLPRRGAALVEGAFVLFILMISLFTAFDLSLAVIRQNALSEMTRRLAREAIVHGGSAGPTMTEWGPEEVSITAADPNYESIVKPLLLAMTPEDVQLRIEWPDAANRPNDRVRVTASYSHIPLMPSVLGASPIPFEATSTMRIAH